MKLPRFILYLLLFVIILVLVNVILMFYMTHSRINRLTDQEKFDFDYKVNEHSFLSIHDLPEDKSGEYYVHKNFIQATNTAKSRDIVLASHCTGDHLNHLVSLTEFWPGPISVAVFVPGYSLENTLAILYILYGCFPQVRRQATIHFVHPISAMLKEADLMFLIRKSQETYTKCSKALKVIKNINKNVAKNYDKQIKYPNNLLRNTAKHGVASKYTLIVDIDMKPNQNLYRDFMKFAEKNNLFDGNNSFHYNACSHIPSTRNIVSSLEICKAILSENKHKGVFVLPAFEMKSTKAREMPKDKTRLIELLDDGAVRPFYYEICFKCQKPTDYERWRSLHSVGKPLDVGYEVKWQDPWEPFFIAPQSAPDYDERFKQYGFNRISNACELHIAGYRYFILDQGFLIHQGFKDITSFHKTKDIENESNKKLFRTFKTELKDKYPESTNRC